MTRSTVSDWAVFVAVVVGVLALVPVALVAAVVLSALLGLTFAAQRDEFWCLLLLAVVAWFVVQ